MAANMVETRVEETVVGGTEEQRGHGRGQRIGRFGRYGLVAAVLITVLMLGVALHERQASHPAAPVTPRGITREGIRFQEENTITLPSAGGSDVAPAVVTGEQQRFLEQNTITLPSAGGSNAVPAIVTAEQQRFLEENSTTLPSAGATAPYMEDFTPQYGQNR